MKIENLSPVCASCRRAKALGYRTRSPPARTIPDYFFNDHKPSAIQGEARLRGTRTPTAPLSTIGCRLSAIGYNQPSAIQGEARLRGLYRIISSKTIFICRWATGRMPVSIMIPSLLCRVVSLRANETPAPPGFLLCGRDARTPRVPLMRTRRPHLPGFLLCGRDARTPRVPLMRTRRPHPQGASYADETPAPPRVPLMRTRRPRTQAVRERAPFQSTGMQRTQRRSQSASIHSTPDLQPSRL
jgi:hypothetical protein